MRLNQIKVVVALKEQDLRQKDLANITGISQNTISAVCNHKKCSESTARKITNALGLRFEDVIEFERTD